MLSPSIITRLFEVTTLKPIKVDNNMIDGNSGSKSNLKNQEKR